MNKGSEFEKKFGQMLKELDIMYTKIDATPSRSGSFPDYLVVPLSKSAMLFELKTSEANHVKKNCKVLWRTSQRVHYKNLKQTITPVYTIVWYVFLFKYVIYGLTNEVLAEYPSKGWLKEGLRGLMI